MTWVTWSRSCGVHRWNDTRTRRATKARLPANSYGHSNATVRANAKTGASWSANGSRSTRARRVASRHCATCPTDPTVGPQLRRQSCVWCFCSCSWELLWASCRYSRQNDRPSLTRQLPYPPRPIPSTCHRTLGSSQISINIF